MENLYENNRHKKLLFYSGIRLSKNKRVLFNWNKNYSYFDILRISGDISGNFDSDNTRYIYGYTFAPNTSDDDKKKVQNYIKRLKYSKRLVSDDVCEFVDNGILSFEANCPFRDFGVDVLFKPSGKLSIRDVMSTYFSDYLSNSLHIDFDILKQTYEDVEFNIVKVADVLRSKGVPEKIIDEEISLILKNFNTLKQSGKLYKIKEFIPEEIRQNFSDFLQFKTDDEREIYQALQGVNVIVWTDFFINDAPFKEVAQYLKAINDKNTLTVFILIGQ